MLARCRRRLAGGCWPAAARLPPAAAAGGLRAARAALCRTCGARGVPAGLLAPGLAAGAGCCCFCRLAVARGTSAAWPAAAPAASPSPAPALRLAPPPTSLSLGCSLARLLGGLAGLAPPPSAAPGVVAALRLSGRLRAVAAGVGRAACRRRRRRRTHKLSAWSVPPQWQREHRRACDAHHGMLVSPEQVVWPWRGGGHAQLVGLPGGSDTPLCSPLPPAQRLRRAPSAPAGGAGCWRQLAGRARAPPWQAPQRAGRLAPSRAAGARPGRTRLGRMGSTRRPAMPAHARGAPT